MTDFNPTEFNLADVFDTVASTIPDTECIVWRDRRLTYADVAERSNRFACFLAENGLGCHTERADLAGSESGQDQLALYLTNGNEYVEAMIGSYKARVAPFNVNYRYVAEELRYLLDNSTAAAVVYGASFAPVLAEVLDDLSRLKLLIQVDDDDGATGLLPGAHAYEDIVTGSDGSRPDVAVSPDDLYILYTGGTTGMPKGVLWRQADIYVAAMGGRPIGGSEELADYDALAQSASNAPGAVKMMCVPPFMHGASQWAMFNTFTGGGTLLIQNEVRRLDAADVLATAAREGAITLLSVGDAIGRPLIEEMERGAHDLSSLMVLVNGGAVLNSTLKDRAIAAVDGLMVYDAVGASETGAQMTHFSTAGEAASSGTFQPGPDTVVVDADLSRVLEPGEDATGWLAQRGRVPLGYLGDADKTARTFPVVGGVRFAIPGDRARIGADGIIELLGRDSVTINSGGEKIFAEEVEQSIAHHPAVYDVVVVGRPSERWGSEVVALVQIHDDMEATAEDLAVEAAKHVARYKLPKDFIFLPALQRSPAGKADYRWARTVAEGKSANG
ncbi:MAG TPA: acyl-CoA synthetase [Acidimicrobiales bacterium]|nr:acyl-CoA synthetase [Acidimicrobiales bacterium]